MQKSITIQKENLLAGSSNYEALRKKGLEYIEQLASDSWTDYNIHDPGITILELLCYAITDLGYRTSLPIKDLLAEASDGNQEEALKRQAFFPAGEILTINPWSVADFRKLLIDLEGVKNAWLSCKACPCGNSILYAKCADSKLQYEKEAGTHDVIIRGFYDVMLEFDNEEGLGNLNSGKVNYNFSFATGESTSIAMIEMRLPSWQEVQQHPEKYKNFYRKGSEIVGVSITGKISDGRDGTADIQDEKLANKIRRPLYATEIFVEWQNVTDAVPIDDHVFFNNIPFRVWFKNDDDRRQIKLADIKRALEEDRSISGIFGKYLRLLQRTDEVMKDATQALLSHRNLCEDYCSINPVQVQEFAVCADIEVEPAADIEAVLAEVYYRIEQYLAPDLKFYSLQQLMNEGVPVDEIFEGPLLNCGFINNEELETTNLREFIYGSDIINLLMDIPGVVCIQNFAINKYDRDGNIVILNPTDNPGENIEWVLKVDHNHQPGLYLEASKILVFKNGLPFLPDRIELIDTMQVIRGKYAQPKFSAKDSKPDIPQGTFYQLNEYYPLQYTLPVTYGVGVYGLPDSATEERKAQAKQLKGYLIFFEQMLLNFFRQLASVKDLFAIDNIIDRTYYSRLLKDEDIKGISGMFNAIDDEVLNGLNESAGEFDNRRNRFLDHIMARFGESFKDYALILNHYGSGRAIGQHRLHRYKTDFLRTIATVSHNRAKATNYKSIDLVNDNRNISGIQLRIQRLLGMDGLGGFFEMFHETGTDGKVIAVRWRLQDENGVVMLVSKTNFKDDKDYVAEEKARAEALNVKKYITSIANYKNTGAGFTIKLTNENPAVIATGNKTFSSKADSDLWINEIIAFGKKLLAADKVFVVEHLLLRPRNYPPAFATGITEPDPLLSICISPSCGFCEGETDPYSFRLTVVLSGRAGIAGKGIEFRRFAEETIRKEIPAHLGVKICWVDYEQLFEFEERYRLWLAALATEPVSDKPLQDALKSLLELFEKLKSVYPEATLHDCVDGNDENRVLLGHTAIISDEELNARIEAKKNSREENNT